MHDMLAERLVRRGLARIHTKGEMVPNLSSLNDYQQHLKQCEAEAKEQRLGGWSR
jgi:endonuclease YncB( thermonuclease family)